MPTGELPVRQRLIGIILSAYLIISFLSRTLITAEEWESSTDRILTIGLDIVVIAGLVTQSSRIPQVLFWVSLLAGIGLLAIRLTLTGWRTGHLMFEVPTR